MNHDIMNVNAVIDERRRMTRNAELGVESLAVRKEVEEATRVEGHSERRKDRRWLARLRQLNLNSRTGSSKHRRVA